MQDVRIEAQRRLNEGWRPKTILCGENAKLLKSAKKNWKTLGLSMAPANLSGFEVCASRSKECTKYCLFYSGRGGAPNVLFGRMARTLWFFQDRQGFMDQLYREIDRNQDAAIRLNVLSDWQWERQFPALFETFPNTQFYDYTKHFKRMFRRRPKNYHLTFSLHEENQHQAKEVLNAGMNVAAVLDQSSGSLFGYQVIDGDEHDLRFLDPSPVVVGLRPKGTLKSDKGPMIYEPKEVFEPGFA